MYLNTKNLLKYLLQFLIVSLTAYTLSPCNLKVSFAVTIGLISASIFSNPVTGNWNYDWFNDLRHGFPKLRYFLFGG